MGGTSKQAHERPARTGDIMYTAIQPAEGPGPSTAPAEPLDDLDAIAALEGVDMLFFGPGDFSQAIGAPGEWNHPLLQETRRRVAKACAAHGKFAGTVGSPANLDELLALGYRFINTGADVIGLAQYCAGLVSEFQKRDVDMNDKSADEKAQSLYA